MKKQANTVEAVKVLRLMPRQGVSILKIKEVNMDAILFVSLRFKSATKKTMYVITPMSSLWKYSEEI